MCLDSLWRLKLNVFAPPFLLAVVAGMAATKRKRSDRELDGASRFFCVAGVCLCAFVLQACRKATRE